MPKTNSADAASLVEAFTRCNQLSEHLTAAYRQLQRRVSELNLRIADAGQVSPAQQLEKERLIARVTGLLEALPAALVLVDPRGRVDQFNAVAESLFPGLRWGRRWSEVLEENLDHQLQADEWRLRSDVRVSVSARPLGDLGQILVLVDVTERRALEQQLQQKERLSALGEMAARLAHQVRTPLSAAVLYAGQLGGGDIGPEQRRRFGDKLLARLRHTEQLVADMLAFARGEPYRPEPVDLQAVLRDALDILSPRLKATGTRLHVETPVAGPAWVLGNAEALVGVVVNVLSNAMEHGGPGVGVRLALIETEAAYDILIEDDGPGVPEHLRVQVFEPFFTTRRAGTGLGLAVAHSVLVEHGGAIRCEGEEGARFLLSLPREAAQSGTHSWRQTA